MKFAAIEDAIEDIRQGRMVLVVDDEARENEGDLVMASVYATAEKVNFMACYARGLICAPVSEEIAKRLQLPPLTDKGTDKHGTAFLVSVDAKEGISTGISAEERAITARLLAFADSRPEDFYRPGHLFPLAARPGGVLRRAGHTEATVDLARLAGLPAAGLCCEIMNDDGTMARLPDLVPFAEKHGLKLISVKDLIAWRSKREKLIEKLVEVNLPTEFGQFRV
ncbi:MAG: 3,4-dihydroxy-2-butanone-4-phosphate synthase, partial [Synergistaceae bacterium]|nr:3,4-dihydroxy-2-butanone-4-phosphate synthase [Synergistaceae bacterium]